MAKVSACQCCRCQPELLERYDKIMMAYRYKYRCKNCDRSCLEWPSVDKAILEWNARQEVLGWL